MSCLNGVRPLLMSSHIQSMWVNWKVRESLSYAKWVDCRILHGTGGWS